MRHRLKWSPLLAAVVFFSMLAMVIGTLVSLLLRQFDVGIMFSLLGISIDVFGILVGSYYEWQRSLTEDELMALSKVFEHDKRRELIKILLRKPDLSLNEIHNEFSMLNIRLDLPALYMHLHELQMVIHNYEERLPTGGIARYKLNEQYRKLFQRYFGVL